MRDPERWWQTFKRALIYGAIAGLALASLGCASTPEKNCRRTACGDLCCNDDGKVCPACWAEDDYPPLVSEIRRASVGS
jgi:hypothetical protein